MLLCWYRRHRETIWDKLHSMFIVSGWYNADHINFRILLNALQCKRLPQSLRMSPRNTELLPPILPREMLLRRPSRLLVWAGRTNVSMWIPFKVSSLSGSRFYALRSTLKIVLYREWGWLHHHLSCEIRGYRLSCRYQEDQCDAHKVQKGHVHLFKLGFFGWNWEGNSGWEDG